MPDLIEGHPIVQLNSLPLPSAALVLDVRGVQDDDVIERLRVEIADLAREMQAYEINHWRHLTKFLSFRVVSPLSSDNITALKKHQKPGDEQPALAQDNTSDEQQKLARGPFQWSDSDPDAPFDIFRQSIEELVLEIDRVRSNRIVAFQDLPKSGKVGQTKRDPTVRVIFITDAKNPESLASATVYAVRLKERFRKRERPGQQAFVSTTVLCLDSRTEEDASAQLIENLSWEERWDHIDSLIVNEQYNAEGALLAGPVQTYLAELILYMLLLIPPLDLSTETILSGHDLHTTQAPQVEGHYLALPPATFNIGMATIEHSARWGHRWLNYSLAVYMIQMLQDKSGESPHELRDIQTTMVNWFNNWRAQIATAIPDKVPGNISGLKAISAAERAAIGPEGVFPDQRRSVKMPEVSLNAVKKHQDRLLSLYTATPDPLYNTPLTLQAAISSIPTIEQRLREWEDREPALKKGMPLVSAQSEAQNVLGRNLSLSKGAVPRARAQLLALSTAISEFQNTRDLNKLDLGASRNTLERNGQELLNNLQKSTQQFPLFANVWQWKTVFAVATAILSLILILVAVLLGLGVTADLIIATHTTSPVLPVILSLLASNSVPGVLFWLVVIALIVAGIVVFRDSLLQNKHSALRIEVNFLLILVLCFSSALVFDFFLTSLLNSGDDLGLLLWLSPLPYIGVILGILALIIFFIEVIYFYTWQNRLLEEREAAIENLNREHLQNVEAVKNYIADSIALELLVRTGLTDADGGPGPYYQRIAQLYKHLNEIFRHAEKQQKLAARRLGSSMNQTQSVMSAPRSRNDGEWLRLRTREEYLDVTALVDGYKRWQAFLEKDSDQVRHFTELLLRIMGQEVPAQIEQQFREKTPLNNFEQHQARLLLEVLVSIILRFALAPDSIGSLSAITDRYDTLSNGYLRELPVIGILIQALNQQVSQVTITPMLEDDQDGTRSTAEDRMQLATEAFATWSQVLWDHQDDSLDRCLSRRGVLAKLMSDPEYDPLALMRQISVRVALFANSLHVGQRGDAYLLLSPSDRSRRFRQSLNIDSNKIHVAEFPDNERLLLFYIQRYVAPPMFIPGPSQAAIGTTQTDTLALPSANTSPATDTSSTSA
jgi:hypothetical protein